MPETDGVARGELVRLEISSRTPYADGKPVSRDGSAPYELTWDTTAATEGQRQKVLDNLQRELTPLEYFHAAMHAAPAAAGVQRPPAIAPLEVAAR